MSVSMNFGVSMISRLASIGAMRQSETSSRDTGQETLRQITIDIVVLSSRIGVVESLEPLKADRHTHPRKRGIRGKSPMNQGFRCRQIEFPGPGRAFDLDC
jgi:hypothetical protein